MLIFLTQQNCQITYLLFFRLFFMLKLDEPFRDQEIFIIIFSTVGIWVLRVKKFLFCSFWMIFCPLDSDPVPGSPNQIMDCLKSWYMFQNASKIRIRDIRAKMKNLELFWKYYGVLLKMNSSFNLNKEVNSVICSSLCA